MSTEPSRPRPPAGPRVLFLHGLESGPQGHKARYLAARFETRTPDMSSSVAAARLDRAHPSVRRSVELDLFRRCLALQRRELAAWRPGVLVASSFGGALAVALLEEGSWAGPTLLLAQAALMARRRNGQDPREARLPQDVPVLLVHGRRDAVVPLADSQLLAATSPRARLVEVDDEHGLDSLCEGERLAELVRELATVEAPRR